MTEWFLPEVLKQVGDTKDLETPLFGLKLHKEQISHMDEILSVRMNKKFGSGCYNVRPTYAPKRDGDWHCYVLEAGYYSFFLCGHSDPSYFRVTPKGYLLEMDPEEVYEDLRSGKDTLSPFMG